MSLTSMSPFQIGILILFVVFIIGGVFIFASFSGLTNSGSIGNITIWGTLDRQVMEEALSAIREADQAYEQVKYEEKDPATYRDELVNALAAGGGPDLVILPQDEIVSFSDKLVPTPFSSLSARNFKNSFIPEADLFLSGQGIIAMPLLIDPLVMYVNRDLFASAGVAQTPRYWDEFFTLAPKLTSIDTRSDVRRSAVALGSFDNIRHAKDILAALFIQAGDPIATLSTEGKLEVVLGDDTGTLDRPAESALRFYTEFSNPAKSVYSWNRALPDSQDAFVAGTVAVYFGFASEFSTLRERNPNLSIEVAPLPQVRDSKNLYTFGRMYALALTRVTQNAEGAFMVAQTFTGDDIAGEFAKALGLPPVKRTLLSDTPEDAAQSVFAESALMARAWLDPEPRSSRAIFKTMIDSVVSGRSEPRSAVLDGARALENILNRP